MFLLCIVCLSVRVSQLHFACNKRDIRVIIVVTLCGQGVWKMCIVRHILCAPQSCHERYEAEQYEAVQYGCPYNISFIIHLYHGCAHKASRQCMDLYKFS